MAPRLWDEVRRVLGEPTLQVRVLHIEEFDSPLKGLASGDHIWPMRAADVPREANLAEGRKAGAVDAGTTLVRLNVSSKFKERVTVHEVSVDIEKKDPPIRGTLYTGNKGATTPVRFIIVDLEKGVVGWTDAKGNPATPITFHIQSGDEENLDVLAVARDGHYRWKLNFKYTVDGNEPKTISITPSGAPTFQTSSLENVARLSPEGCIESVAEGPPLC